MIQRANASLCLDTFYGDILIHEKVMLPLMSRVTVEVSVLFSNSSVVMLYLGTVVITMLECLDLRTFFIFNKNPKYVGQSFVLRREVFSVDPEKLLHWDWVVAIHPLKNTTKIQ